jgi:photosystem II stability/assembly factor-like uncharacterized protein
MVARPSGRSGRFVALLFVAALLAPAAPPAFAQTDDGPGDDPPPSMETLVAPTPAGPRMEGYEQRRALVETSLVKRVPFEGIGPTVMSGRVVDVAVNPNEPTHFYVAYASGGVWRTTNNGRSFTPLFDEREVMTVGDIAVDWDDGETVWVGTGENNSSRSSYAGTGLYKSTDRGETWQHVGLAAVHRTGRIRIHPDDPQTVWVAAAGPLYSPNEERGVYRTTDGGETWTKTLYVNDRTGAIDLAVRPDDPDVLYAAMWERSRRAWNFVENGAGSGIYRSSDGGQTWTQLNTAESGFPSGDSVGRIGLAIAPSRPDTLYALLDNQSRRPEQQEDDPPALTKDMLRSMSREAFLDLSEEALTAYLDRNGFPASYTATSIVEMVREGEIEPVALVRYVEDANEQLFDTPVVGPEVYRSTDGGDTWARTHDDFIDGLYYSYGYYFGEIRVAPQDAETLYVLGVPMLKSTDGGATFDGLTAGNLHVDHHALWLNPNRTGHLVAGNDGGVNLSYDGGGSWFKANTPPVGQFYAVQVDDAEPYHVYGGLQDNGVWEGPHTYQHSYEWYAEGDYPYDRLLGGDGMQVEVDTRTNDIVYTGFQFGNYYRINKETGETTPIKPQHDLGERPYRFNWLTPTHLSNHNQDILYLGSQYLHRSLDRGETWEKISPDLTKGGRQGNVPFGTLTSIDESPLRFGLLYAGSDDGLVHVSRDGGASWTQIDDGLPENLWVSRVEASHHDTSRVYVTLNGYRWDHFEAYVYRSDDYGRSWTRVGTDLPTEPVNVVLEDPANEDVLYVGTDHGLYASLDRGASFMSLEKGLPDAPVHDVKIQEREKDLIVGTHGRSIYRAGVEHLQQLTPDLREKPLHLFAVDSLRYDEGWGAESASWAEADTPAVTIPYYSGADGPVTVRVETEGGLRLHEHTHEAAHGLNYASYGLTADSTQAKAYNDRRAGEGGDAGDEPMQMQAADDGTWYLLPGRYTLTLEREGETVETPLVVREPPSSPRRSGGPEAEGVPAPAEEK